MPIQLNRPNENIEHGRPVRLDGPVVALAGGASYTIFVTVYCEYCAMW